MRCYIRYVFILRVYDKLTLRAEFQGCKTSSARVNYVRRHSNSTFVNEASWTIGKTGLWHLRAAGILIPYTVKSWLSGVESVSRAFWIRSFVGTPNLSLWWLRWCARFTGSINSPFAKFIFKPIDETWNSLSLSTRAVHLVLSFALILSLRKWSATAGLAAGVAKGWQK